MDDCLAAAIHRHGHSANKSDPRRCWRRCSFFHLSFSCFFPRPLLQIYRTAPAAVHYFAFQSLPLASVPSVLTREAAGGRGGRRAGVFLRPVILFLFCVSCMQRGPVEAHSQDVPLTVSSENQRKSRRGGNLNVGNLSVFTCTMQSCDPRSVRDGACCSFCWLNLQMDFFCVFFPHNLPSRRGNAGNGCRSHLRSAWRRSQSDV